MDFSKRISNPEISLTYTKSLPSTAGILQFSLSQKEFITLNLALNVVTLDDIYSAHLYPYSFLKALQT